jgi:hypothetical protein
MKFQLMFSKISLCFSLQNSTAPIPLDSADVSSILKLNRSHSYTVESPTGSWANLAKLNDEQTLPLVRIECELHPEELNVDVRFLVRVKIFVFIRFVLQKGRNCARLR